METINLLASGGFAADVQAVTNFGMVVLHKWDDGDLLVMEGDEAIPTRSERLSASGYVFLIVEPSETGPLIWEGKHYAVLEIYDHVLWTNERAAQAKYEEVVARAQTG